jgi:uncharacterized membrane protein YjgN (DUF898 family)
MPVTMHSELAVVPRPFEFRGTGREFFRIWVVNLALTLLTLGIYSAWAKVRTRRYFNGNFYVAGHSFDYHASPVRILIGRIVALVLLIGYNATITLEPLMAYAGLVLFAVAAPWLIVSSLRFNARNTSYRNVRFGFAGSYWGAFQAMVLWSLAALATLGALIPMAHRARSLYYVNNHRFGGKPFATDFTVRGIYGVYGRALLFLLVFLALGGGASAFLYFGAAFPDASAGLRARISLGALGIAAALGWVAMLAQLRTLVFNLAVGHTVLDGSHRLGASLSPWTMLWIAASNLILILMTLGLFYPWARVRIARYTAKHMTLVADSNLDKFVSEPSGGPNAIGEEVAGFFDFDIGL